MEPEPYVDPWPLPVHPLVEVAREVAAVLAAQAATVDRDGVPASHIDLLKSSGLLGVNGPVHLGGAGAEAAVFYAVTELLAAADLSTWFVQAQHHMPLRFTAASALIDDAGRERLLRPLCDGTSLSGFVFSQLRSYPRVQVSASQVAGGWVADRDRAVVHRMGALGHGAVLRADARTAKSSWDSHPRCRRRR